MKTVKSENSNEIVIKNSKFISYIKNVTTEEEIKEYLSYLSKEYKDATHITYAYRLKDRQKYSDDNEPGGTAGAPIMEVVLKNDLINVIIVVIRYFGGIKLGAGGLIRAYSKAAREALQIASLEEYILYNYYKISSSYDDLKLLNTLTKDLDIIKKDFGERIIYEIKIEENKDKVKALFKNTNIEIEKI